MGKLKFELFLRIPVDWVSNIDFARTVIPFLQLE